MILKGTKVIFREENHTYWLGDQQLSGITGIISSMLFPDKYGNAPQRVIDNAKRRGDSVHTELEFIDSMGIAPKSEHAKRYCRIKEEQGLTPVANEFLVSDELRIATKIDCVYQGAEDGVCDLCDFKTTYVLDEEYVAWQLSICSWLFERQTGLKVGRIFAIWLREDKDKFVELQRKPQEDVMELLDCYFSGTPYTKAETSLAVSDIMPQKYMEMAEQIRSWEVQKKQMDAKDKELREALRKAMMESGVKKWMTDNMTITLTEPTTKTDIDKTRLKKEHPEVYSSILKTTNVQQSLRITIK